MSNSIKVMVLEPGLLPYLKDVANELGPLQKLVGGFIELHHVAGQIKLLCNEEGRLLALPPMDVRGSVFFGTLVFVRDQDGDFVSLTEEDVKLLNTILK